MAAPPQEQPKPISTLILEESDGGFGLKIPEFNIEMYGEDLPELIEQAEERLWWTLGRRGRVVPERVVLAVTRVTKDEFGPTYFERDAEDEFWGNDE